MTKHDINLTQNIAQHEFCLPFSKNATSFSKLRSKWSHQLHPKYLISLVKAGFFSSRFVCPFFPQSSRKKNHKYVLLSYFGLPFRSLSLSLGLCTHVPYKQISGLFRHAGNSFQCDHSLVRFPGSVDSKYLHFSRLIFVFPAILRGNIWIGKFIPFSEEMRYIAVEF